MYGSLHIYLTYFSWLVLSKSEIVKKSCPIDKDYVAGSPQTQTFAYDNGDRLISAAASGGSGGTYSETYTYNPVSGNLASKGGATYTYGDAAHKHAVTSRSGGWLYTYDANGNMLTRVGGGKTFNYAYDAENHLTSVSGSTTASMVYDGDGNRVKATIGGTTTVFIGKHFEWTGSTSTLIKYFYAGNERVAMKKGSTVYYLFGDHLGSTAITASSAGAKLGELRYKPWGETRYTWGTTYTDRHFTGQLDETTAIGLYFFNARFYDPLLARFTSADSLIPDPGNPQAWDRYAYGLNNPVKYIDPTGHISCEKLGTEECDKNGNFVNNEPPPVVQYIYGEMIKNAKSNVTLFIMTLNSQSQFVTGGVAKAEAYTLWGVMVRTNGPWDHKSYIRNMEKEAGRHRLYQRVGEFEYKFDTWSNIHYGYVGAGAGFSSEELLNGAGFEQIGTNMMDRRGPVAAPGVSGLKRYDDPYDQAGIELGYQLWLDHGLALKLEDLIQALAYAPGLNRRPFGGESQ